MKLIDGDNLIEHAEVNCESSDFVEKLIDYIGEQEEISISQGHEDDLISLKAAIDAVTDELDMIDHVPQWVFDRLEKRLKQLPSAQPEVDCQKCVFCGFAGFKQFQTAQPEDYTELKREFLRLASYSDVLLECSDEQKETLMGFISRLAEFMPWTERD